ncbi:MAG: DNA translocase FtsK 4TM domain-containing protein, partial [Planctomycetia bacterium]
MAFADRSVSAPFPSRPPFGAGQPSGRFGAACAAAIQESPEHSATLPRNRFRDVSALAILAGCLFAALALATFDPADPPLAAGFPPHARATNACGYLGAAVAGAVYQWLGLGGWFALAAVAAYDLTLLRRRPLPDLPLRTAGIVAATLGVCTLLTMFLPAWVARPVWGPGGQAGAVGRLFAEGYFASTGAAIVVTAITAAGLFLACDTLVLRVAGALVAACTATLAAIAALVAHGRSRLALGTGGGAVADALPPFPGLRLRSARDDADAEDADAETDADGADDDADEDAESLPAIRVRRREKPVADDASDSPDDVEDSDDGADADAEEKAEEAEAEEPRPVVPIRSITSRRRKPEPLQMAPDPAANYELPALDLLLPAEQLH